MNAAAARTPAQARRVLGLRAVGRWVHVVAGPESGRYRRRLRLVGGLQAGMYAGILRARRARTPAASSTAASVAAIPGVVAQQAGKRPDQVDRQRENDRRRGARAQLEQRLEVAQ